MTPPPRETQEQLVHVESATKPARERRGGRLQAYVARVGDSLVAVRAWDEADAVDRILDQCRLGYLVGVAEDVHVRLATPDDVALLPKFEGGSHLFRCEWKTDARAQASSSSHLPCSGAAVPTASQEKP